MGYSGILIKNISTRPRGQDDRPRMATCRRPDEVTGQVVCTGLVDSKKSTSLRYQKRAGEEEAAHARREDGMG